MVVSVEVVVFELDVSDVADVWLVDVTLDVDVWLVVADVVVVEVFL